MFQYETKLFATESIFVGGRWIVTGHLIIHSLLVTKILFYFYLPGFFLYKPILLVIKVDSLKNDICMRYTLILSFVLPSNYYKVS